jgi:hypothetical protein
LKEDTIPKPDGLAMVTESTKTERNSDNVEQRSKMIEDCSHCVRELVYPAGRASDGSLFQHGDDLQVTCRTFLSIGYGHESRSKAAVPSRLEDAV